MPCQARSTAKRLRSAREQKASAPSWVARSTTRGAWPASNASCQRGAQRHQRSPGLRPGNPNSGIGVERSLPRDLENARNGAVITVQTVWLPKSSREVSQQPSRKNPVIGLNEQISSRSPSTLRGVPGRSPSFLPVSLSIAANPDDLHPSVTAIQSLPGLTGQARALIVDDGPTCRVRKAALSRGVRTQSYIARCSA